MGQVEQWVELLRSGKYKQGMSFLKTFENGESRYCCLGVAAEGVLGRKFECPSTDGRVREYRVGNSWAYTVLMSFDADTLGLFETVTEEQADYLTETYGVSIEEDVPYTNVLTRLNDDGIDFEEIADVLEYLCLQ